jgi:hypothetical protein
MQKNSVTTCSATLAAEDGDACAPQNAPTLRNELARLYYALTEVELENTLRQLAPVVRRTPPALHRWPRARNGLLEMPSLGVLKSNVAALRFQLVLWQFAYREHKAGFDPNQPRVPRGQPTGGQWTDAGGSGGASGGDDDANPSDWPQGDQAPLRIVIYYPRSTRDGSDGSESSSGSPPLGEPPAVPTEEPATTQALNSFIKAAAYWLAKAALREVASPAIGTFVNVLDAAYWGYKAYPYIKAYLDPPMTLTELQAAASKPARGYDIHHIVEKTQAERDRYPRSMIDAPDNLVRVPTLKHWQITGWYMSRNDEFGGLSPREYLRDKDWNERIRVGRQALIRYGVLKP